MVTSSEVLRGPVGKLRLRAFQRRNAELLRRSPSSCYGPILSEPRYRKNISRDAGRPELRPELMPEKPVDNLDPGADASGFQRRIHCRNPIDLQQFFASDWSPSRDRIGHPGTLCLSCPATLHVASQGVLLVENHILFIALFSNPFQEFPFPVMGLVIWVTK